MSHITHPAQHSAFNPRQEGITWKKYENRECRQSLLSPGISSWFVPFSRSDLWGKLKPSDNANSHWGIHTPEILHLTALHGLISTAHLDNKLHIWKCSRWEKCFLLLILKPCLLHWLPLPRMWRIIPCLFSPRKLQFHAPPVLPLLLLEKHITWI